MLKKTIIILSTVLLILIFAIKSSNSQDNYTQTYKNTINKIMSNPNLTADQKSKQIQEAMNTYMQSLFKDPTIPEEAKVAIRKSLGNAKIQNAQIEEQQRIEKENRLKKEQEIAKLKNEEEAKRFTITDTNGIKYNGRIINGRYYYIVPSNITKVSNAQKCGSDRGVYCYTPYDEFLTAQRQCAGVPTGTARLVQLDELKSLCRDEQKRWDNKDKNFHEFMSLGVTNKFASTIFTYKPNAAYYSAICSLKLQNKEFFNHTNTSLGYNDDWFFYREMDNKPMEYSTPIQGEEITADNSKISTGSNNIINKNKTSTKIASSGPYYHNRPYNELDLKPLRLGYSTVCEIVGNNPAQYIDKK